MDLQRKLTTSKATNTTVQDVHHDIASLRDKEKPMQAYSYYSLCLRSELRYRT